MNNYIDKVHNREIANYKLDFVNSEKFQNEIFICKNCKKEFKIKECNFDYINDIRALSGNEYINYYCPVCSARIGYKLLAMS